MNALLSNDNPTFINSVNSSYSLSKIAVRSGGPVTNQHIILSDALEFVTGLPKQTDFSFKRPQRQTPQAALRELFALGKVIKK
jgi:hypothetical protein